MTTTEEEYQILVSQAAKGKAKKPKPKPRRIKSIGNEQVFFIPEILPGMNEIIAASNSSKHKYNRMKKDCEELISWAIVQAQIKPVKDFPAYLTYLWIEPNKKRDKSNIAVHKFIEDALVSSGILPNDGWRYIDSWTDKFMVNKNRPGVRVSIWPGG